MKARIITVIGLMVFALAPLSSVSADMWSETPGTFDEPGESFGSATLVYNRPAVNLWAETPDANANQGDYDLELDAEARFVNSNKPGMYAETPGTDALFAAEKDEPGDRGIAIVKK